MPAKTSPPSRRLTSLATSLALAWSGQASALTLVGTNAGVLDTSHLQVATTGGDQPHLMRVVTPSDRLNSAIDADVLLADGSPLAMTWRRDGGDADVIELALALVIDSRPCHVDLRLMGAGDAHPHWIDFDDVNSGGVAQQTSDQRVVLHFPIGVEPLEDIFVGNVDTTIGRNVTGSWRVDIAATDAEGTFEIALRAGPPGDVDDDDDVDLHDYAELRACLDGDDTEADCAAYFDFDANRVVDLRDFAEFQRRFTGANVPAACGG